MIKFFRQLRQNLVAEGKTASYLKYAVGEIVLVVIGILIALSINNWNERRKDVQREIKMLYDLQNDVNYNIKNIDEGITYLEEGIDHSNVILSAFEKQLKYDTVMKQAFRFYGYFWDPDFRIASFENLKKEGVNLISNDTLRNKIVDLFEIDMDILNVSDLNRHNDFMTSVGNGIVNKHLYFDRKTGDILPFNYEAMMTDKAFYSFTSLLLTHQYVALRKSKKFVEKSQSLNEQITKEIKRLK